jgi:hypothetical protein
MARRDFPPDHLRDALTDTITEIAEFPNPPRRERSYPRVVKRYKAHFHPLKRPRHRGGTHRQPAKIYIFNLGLT